MAARIDLFARVVTQAVSRLTGCYVTPDVAEFGNVSRVVTSSRIARRTLLVVALVLSALVAAPAGPAAAATWQGRYSLWRGSAFAPQYLDASCVGATIQIMLNLIHGRASDGKRVQLEYLAYAADNSEYPVTDDGADPEGWAQAMRRFGAGESYGWVNDDTIEAALHRAASQMRKTRSPVGLLVHFGRHAWVMTGFEATADPNVTNDYEVTAAEVVGPLWPDGRLNGQKFDPGPRTWMDVRTLSRKFDRYVVPGHGLWFDNFVTIVPRASDTSHLEGRPVQPNAELPDLATAAGWVWVFSRLAERLPVRGFLWLP